MSLVQMGSLPTFIALQLRMESNAGFCDARFSNVLLHEDQFLSCLLLFWINGNKWWLPSTVLYLWMNTLCWNIWSMSTEVGIFSSSFSILLFTLLRCLHVSVKHANLAHQSSHIQYSQNPPFSSTAKNASISYLSSYIWAKSLNLGNHLTSVQN
jgi:hypothetical protein